MERDYRYSKKSLHTFIVITLLLCTGLLVCGCSENEKRVYDNSLRIPLIGNNWLEIPIADDMKLTTTDGYVVWTFEGGGCITKYQGSSLLFSTEHLNEVVYSNSELDVTISISGDKGWVSYLKDNRDKIILRKGSVKLESDKQVEYWSVISHLDCVETDNGVYMPGDFIYNSWMMPVYKNGTSYFTTCIRYWSEDEVQNACLGYLAANDQGDIQWSKGDGNMLFLNDKVGIGYVKVTENKYVVYLASYDMFDYVLYNVQRS